MSRPLWRQASTRLLLTASLLATAALAGCVEPPENVQCRAGAEGNRITWDAAENATHYEVQRALGDGDFTPIANTTFTEYLDTNVSDGSTYRYRVVSVALVDPGDGTMQEFRSEPSTPCEVTAIPFFPGIGLAAVALVGGAAGYGIFRSRRPEA